MGRRIGKLDTGGTSSGITIRYNPRTLLITINGHYKLMTQLFGNDSGVGIDGRELGLAEFCDELGITENDLARARRRSRK